MILILLAGCAMDAQPDPEPFDVLATWVVRDDIGHEDISFLFDSEGDTFTCTLDPTDDGGHVFSLDMSGEEGHQFSASNVRFGPDGQLTEFGEIWFTSPTIVPLSDGFVRYQASDCTVDMRADWTPTRNAVVVLYRCSVTTNDNPRVLTVAGQNTTAAQFRASFCRPSE